MVLLPLQKESEKEKERDKQPTRKMINLFEDHNMVKYNIIPTGRVWVEPAGAFGLVPKALWGKYQTENDRNLIPMDLNSLLIIDGEKTILIDTGLGTKLSEKELLHWNLEFPEGTLLENLKKHNYSPKDIEIVINTHLHSDHCGGNTIMTENGIVPQFPNAKYYVQRIEWADLMNPSARTKHTYTKDNIQSIWKAGMLNFLHGDSNITENVKVKVVPGHSRSNQVIIIEGETHPTIFMGDLASYAVNFTREAWVPAYDLEPQENIRSKKEIQDYAYRTGAKIIFQHDTIIQSGYLIKNEKGKWDIKVDQSGSD